MPMHAYDAMRGGSRKEDHQVVHQVTECRRIDNSGTAETETLPEQPETPGGTEVKAYAGFTAPEKQSCIDRF